VQDRQTTMLPLARIEEIQQELLADDIDIDYVRCAASPSFLLALHELVTRLLW
jgi:hypothetical protein